MKFFSAGGCPARRELFADQQRQCDGQEIDTEIALSCLQQSQRIVQTYNKLDIV